MSSDASQNNMGENRSDKNANYQTKQTERTSPKPAEKDVCLEIHPFPSDRF